MSLAKAIAADGSFDLFVDQLQRLGKSGSLTSQNELAGWLVERAQEVGSEQAVAEAREYSTADEIEVFEVMLLASVYGDARSYPFCNGVVFAMPEKLPMKKFARKFINTEFYSPIPLPKVVGVLYAPFIQSVCHKPSQFDLDEPRDSEPFKVPIDPLLDVMRCLALARPPKCGVQAIAHGTVAADHQPFYRYWSGWGLLPLRHY